LDAPSQIRRCGAAATKMPFGHVDLRQRANVAKRGCIGNRSKRAIDAQMKQFDTAA
jgi:hypothetical protein